MISESFCLSEATFFKGVTNGVCEHSQACEQCDFFASTAQIKKFALRAASSLESTTRE